MVYSVFSAPLLVVPRSGASLPFVLDLPGSHVMTPVLAAGSSAAHHGPTPRRAMSDIQHHRPNLHRTTATEELVLWMLNDRSVENWLHRRQPKPDRASHPRQ